LAHAKTTLGDHALDLAAARFMIHAPPRPPAAGYGVIVFIPPWDRAVLPSGWGDVLDRSGFVFVTAANSGNEASILGRRIPLALAGLAEVARRYPIDPRRVYIAGLSGGSRVAMRVALGYPDVFPGAILNAGSDLVGTPDAPLPPRELMLRLQSEARWILMTGDRDELNANKDLATEISLSGWCMTAVDAVRLSGKGHEILDADALARAIANLARPVRPDAAKLAACRARLDREVDAEADKIRGQTTAADKVGARDRLKRLDARFGGWAAARTEDLYKSLPPPK
jgi:pimeloyl-ACP methyl ester carboxylesterase